MNGSSPYQKVIYKGQEDASQGELVNSMKYRPVESDRKRNWSPRITKEETLRKKRLREDDYAKTLAEESKPILLIQSKQVYADPKNKEIINEVPREDEYFKVTERAQVIDDVAAKLDETRDLKPRPTRVHKAPGAGAEEDLEEEEPLNAIYKIRGIEFLPEGFLELDPMLFKDEYEFVSEADLEMFKDDQRKIRVQRRRQYAQRDLPRQREVTIFIADEYKDRLVEYFETFYADKQRKLNQEELEYIAKAVGSNAGEVAKLQELYLDKKRQANARRINKLIFGRYMDKDGQWHEVPDILKKFLAKEYPEGLQGEAAKRKGKKAKGAKAGEAAKGRVFATPDQLGATGASNERSDEVGQKISGDFNSLTQPLAATGDVARKPFSNMYYDSQISAILDKIRGGKDAEGRGRPTFANGLGSQDHNAQTIRRLIEEDDERNMNEMDRLLRRYDVDPELFRKRGLAELVNNRAHFKIEGEELELPFPRLSAKASAFKSHRGTLDSTGGKLSKASYPVARFSVAPKELQKDVSMSHQGSISFKGSVKNSVGFDRDTFGPSAKNSDLKDRRQVAVKSVTVISRGHILFPRVTPQFAPHCPPILYAYEVVSDSFEKNDRREFLITTLDRDANVVFMDEIAEKNADPLYHGFLNGQYDAGTFLVVLRGENGEILEVVKLDSGEELDEAKVRYLVGDKDSGAAVVVEEVVGEQDEAPSEADAKEAGKAAGKGKSNTVSGMPSRPKNISLMKPRAYTNISNILGAYKRTDSQTQGEPNEAGEFVPGRTTSMSGKKSGADAAEWNKLGEEEGESPAKKSSNAPKASVGGRPYGATEVYNKLKQEELDRMVLTKDKSRGSETSPKRTTASGSKVSRPQGVTALYNEMKDEAFEELNQGGPRGSSQNKKSTAGGSKVSRPPGVTELYNEMKDEALGELGGEEGRASASAQKKSSVSPGRASQNDKKVSFVKNSKASRVSADGQPVRVTELYENLKTDSLEELAKLEEEEANRPQGKSTVARGGSKVGQKTSVSPRPSEKKSGAVRSSVNTGAEESLTESNVSEGQAQGEARPSQAPGKGGSVVDAKISRLSKEGRPTNYSMFYKNYIDNTVDEFGNEIPEEKRSTIRPISTSVLAKKLAEERASKASSSERHSQAKRPTEAKKVSLSEARESARGMPAKIRSVLEAESNQASQKDLEKVEAEIKQQFDPRMIDEFYRFCRETLPDDARYKESILFVSLFYYFLEVKGLLTEPANK